MEVALHNGIERCPDQCAFAAIKAWDELRHGPRKASVTGVEATLSRPTDRRYGPRRGNASVKPQSDRDGEIARDMDQVPKSEASGPQRMA